METIILINGIEYALPKKIIDQLQTDLEDYRVLSNKEIQTYGNDEID